MMRRFLVLLLAAFTLHAAIGATMPKPSPFDKRIRIVEYNPLDVVEISAHYGYQVHFLLGAGEVVENITPGDELGWTIGPKKIKNYFYLKPKEEKPTTNLSIVTRTAQGEARVYTFHLTAEWPIDSPNKDSDMMYRVQFTYPQVESDAVKTARSVDQIKDKLANAGTEKPRNYHYSFSGAPVFEPEEVYDDGLFTYIKFPAKTPRPAIFYIDVDGSEHTADVHNEDEWVVVQTVRPQIVFRKDNAVAGIFNESYDAKGTPNRSGTVSPDVKRILKGGE